MNLMLGCVIAITCVKSITKGKSVIVSDDGLDITRNPLLVLTSCWELATGLTQNNIEIFASVLSSPDSKRRVPTAHRAACDCC